MAPPKKADETMSLRLWNSFKSPGAKGCLRGFSNGGDNAHTAATTFFRVTIFRAK